MALHPERASVAVFHVEAASYIVCSECTTLEVIHVQGVEVSHNNLALRQVLEQVVSSVVWNCDFCVL